MCKALWRSKLGLLGRKCPHLRWTLSTTHVRFWIMLKTVDWSQWSSDMRENLKEPHWNSLLQGTWKKWTPPQVSWTLELQLSFQKTLGSNSRLLLKNAHNAESSGVYQVLVPLTQHINRAAETAQKCPKNKVRMKKQSDTHINHCSCETGAAQ